MQDPKTIQDSFEGPAAAGSRTEVQGQGRRRSAPHMPSQERWGALRGCMGAGKGGYMG